MENLRKIIEGYDAVLIGAGSGLSTSAGFTYSGERFRKYFSDFSEKYGFADMYSGGFTDFESIEENWAYWSRYIYINRYMKSPVPLYERLFSIVKDSDYFVLTTNVDHCFQKAGFSKDRLFYTQGDYGLWQCSKPCSAETYDNRDQVLEMIKNQGWIVSENNDLVPGKNLRMEIDSALVPKCPHCGRPMSMNLRADDTFVEDEGWHEAADRYEKFVNDHSDSKLLFLELGVGGNTPGIIKYPFWNLTYRNPKSFYVCVNKGEAVCPREIEDRSLCINCDIGAVLGAAH